MSTNFSRFHFDTHHYDDVLIVVYLIRFYVIELFDDSVVIYKLERM